MTVLIKKVDTLPLAIPFTLDEPAEGFAAADWTHVYMLLVRVETDDGMVGWGEAFGFNCWRAVKAALDDMVAPLAVGEDAEDIAALSRKIQMGIHTYGRYGVSLYALSGMDIALWDLAGKRAGVPLCQLLGDTQRTTLPGYASLFRYANVAAVERACERWIATGAKHVKLHENDPQIIVAASKVCVAAQAKLMLDVNCCWNYPEALAFVRANEAIPVHWLEEPVFPPEDFVALAQLRRNGSMPVAAGENACTEFQFAQMLQAGAVDYAQPSVTKVGGVSEFVKVAALAREHNVTLAPHSPYFGAGLLATLHLCAALPETTHVEHFCLDLEASPFDKHVLMCDGEYAVPDGPGLGVEPDQAVIDRYLVK